MRLPLFMRVSFCLGVLLLFESHMDLLIPELLDGDYFLTSMFCMMQLRSWASEITTGLVGIVCFLRPHSAGFGTYLPNFGYCKGASL